MKKFLSILLISASLSTPAYAECDFSTGITRQGDSFIYSKDCNLKVGQMKQDLELVQTQLDQYKKAIELKNLALTKTEERANSNMETVFKLQDRMNTIEDHKTSNQLLTFGLGVLFMSLAVYGAGQLR